MEQPFFSSLTYAWLPSDISLALKSRYITTFAAYKGQLHYKRLNFDTNLASDYCSTSFRNRLITFRVCSISVMTLFCLERQRKTTTRHYMQHVNSFKVLDLTTKKSAYSTGHCIPIGFVFSADGISPDPQKVQAIHDAQPPTTTTAVQSFQGMATYCK